MLIDTHVHIGQFYDHVFSPLDIVSLMSATNVDFYIISSTSVCEENYEKVIDEITRLIKIDGEKVLPVMWITPFGLKGSIAWYLESGIKWRMIKIHPELHPDSWDPKGQNMSEVIDIAREMELPILIHTGNYMCCHAGLYKEIIFHNPDVTFILAHGRPMEGTKDILLDYENVYADSAFMPIEDMKAFCDAGLSHKLLWGTDMCIPKHFYPNEDMVKYYLRKLDSFKHICTKEQYEQVTFLNAAKLFDLPIK